MNGNVKKWGQRLKESWEQVTAGVYQKGPRDKQLRRFEKMIDTAWQDPACQMLLGNAHGQGIMAYLISRGAADYPAHWRIVLKGRQIDVNRGADNPAVFDRRIDLETNSFRVRGYAILRCNSDTCRFMLKDSRSVIVINGGRHNNLHLQGAGRTAPGGDGVSPVFARKNFSPVRIRRSPYVEKSTIKGVVLKGYAADFAHFSGNNFKDVYFQFSDYAVPNPKPRQLYDTEKIIRDFISRNELGSNCYLNTPGMGMGNAMPDHRARHREDDPGTAAKTRDNETAKNNNSAGTARDSAPELSRLMTFEQGLQLD